MYQYTFFTPITPFLCKMWHDSKINRPAGSVARLAIQRSRVRVPLLPLAGFVSRWPRVQILSHTCKYQNSLRRPVGIPNIVWIICFSCLLGPTSLHAIITAECKYRHVTRDISTRHNFEILLITHQSDCCEMYVTWKIALYLVLWMTDIDECARGQHDCGRQQTCVNNDGSYSCACSRGYEASGRSCFGQCLQWKFV